MRAHSGLLFPSHNKEVLIQRGQVCVWIGNFLLIDPGNEKRRIPDSNDLTHSERAVGSSFELPNQLHKGMPGDHVQAAVENSY